MEHYSCIRFIESQANRNRTTLSGRPPGKGSWRVNVKTSEGRYSLSGWNLRDAAAWHADVARKFFIHHQIMSAKGVVYNFPERVATIDFDRDVGMTIRKFVDKILAADERLVERIPANEGRSHRKIAGYSVPQWIPPSKR